MARRVEYNAGQQAREFLEAYTDVIDQKQRIYAYGYYVDAITKTGWDEFYQKIDFALMSALGAVRDSRNKRVRERAFTLWQGEYATQYWIAIPAGLSAAVTVLLCGELGGLEEYYGTDFGSNVTMQLEPFRRYDHGRIVYYMPEDRAGSERLASFPDGRAPLEIYDRCWRPSMFPGVERYGQLPQPSDAVSDTEEAK